MDGEALLFYAFLAAEALICVVIYFVVNSRRRRVAADLESDDAATTAEAEHATEYHAASVTGARAATVLYTALTARQQRRQGNFATYFPPAEAGPRVVEGKVVEGSLGVAKEGELDKDAPYGKADYIHRHQSPAAAMSSPHPPM
jgi:hypothetical protein